MFLSQTKLFVTERRLCQIFFSSLTEETERRCCYKKKIGERFTGSFTGLFLKALFVANSGEQIYALSRNISKIQKWDNGRKLFCGALLIIMHCVVFSSNLCPLFGPCLCNKPTDRGRFARFKEVTLLTLCKIHPQNRFGDLKIFSFHFCNRKHS